MSKPFVMREYFERGNDTINSTHLNIIVALMCIMKSYFHVRSFTVVGNEEKFRPWMVEFQKIVSARNIQMNFDSTNGTSAKINEDIGYLVFTNNANFNFTKIIEIRSKLIIAISLTYNNNLDPPGFVENLIIPYRTSFFIVELANVPNNKLTTLIVTGKCLRVYKPSEEIPGKLFPTLYHGGANGRDLHWNWESPGLTWKSYEKDTKNLSGILFKVGSISLLPEIQAMAFARSSINSFYWYILKDTFHFNMSYDVEKNRENWETYMSLLVKRVDGLAGIPVITSDRAPYVDYIILGLDSEYHIWLKIPEFIYSWESVIKPFALKTWLFVILSILLMAIVFWLTLLPSHSNSKNFSGCFLTFFGFLCYQGTTHMPRNISGRIVCYIGLVFSFVIYQYYSLNLFSILSTKQPYLPFRSVEEFLAKGTHKLYMHTGIGIYSLLKNATKGLFKEVWDRALKTNENHRYSQSKITELINKLCNEKAVTIATVYQMLYMRGRKCPLMIADSGFHPSSLVIMLKKNYPFTPQFQAVVQKLLEAGISHKFKKDQLGLDHNKIPKVHLTNEPVGLEQVALLFGMYGAFIIISCIILCCEIYHAKRSKNTKKRIRNIYF